MVSANGVKIDPWCCGNGKLIEPLFAEIPTAGGEVGNIYLCIESTIGEWTFRTDAEIVFSARIHVVMVVAEYRLRREQEVFE